MTKIYLVRHCEALGNLRRVFQGTTDLDITDLGEKQLEKLSERFDGIKLDKIYSSPLIRAYKTALAIKGNRDIEIEIYKDLSEIDGGIIEGKPFTDTLEKDPVLKEIWLNHPEDFAPEGGEPMRESYQRITNAFWDIVNQNKGKTVALATHGGIIRCLLCKLIYDDISKLITVPLFDNTAVGYIEIDDSNKIELKFINDYSHLPSDMLRSSSRPSLYTMRDNK
ncbi:MAG: histidine phosphatase family protein [Clostridia bacterium]|nr:histidine phosphatase family protein [Clostridia bacterium]